MGLGDSSIALPLASPIVGGREPPGYSRRFASLARRSECSPPAQSCSPYGQLHSAPGSVSRAGVSCRDSRAVLRNDSLYRKNRDAASVIRSRNLGALCLVPQRVELVESGVGNI